MSDPAMHRHVFQGKRSTILKETILQLRGNYERKSLGYLITLVLTFSLSAFGQKTGNGSKYIFFLHNRFVQLYEPHVAHPEYGKAEYAEIVNRFRQNGFTVISEKRSRNAGIPDYADKTCAGIDSLIRQGVDPQNITVVGTSMGGYIAQYVSTRLRNPKLNFVLIGCYMDQDLISMPEIQLCGNILSIYEQTDTLGVSMKKRISASKSKIPHFREIALHTNLKHGFLYHPLDEWMLPTMLWARGKYDLESGE